MADLEQVQAERLDLGQHAVQRGTVQQPGEHGMRAVMVRGPSPRGRAQSQESGDARSLRRMPASLHTGCFRADAVATEREVVILMSDATSSSSGLGRRRWLILGVIALAQLMVVLDLTIMNIALPSAQRALG